MLVGIALLDSQRPRRCPHRPRRLVLLEAHCEILGLGRGRYARADPAPPCWISCLDVCDDTPEGQEAFYQGQETLIGLFRPIEYTVSTDDGCWHQPPRGSLGLFLAAFTGRSRHGGVPRLFQTFARVPRARVRLEYFVA